MIGSSDESFIDRNPVRSPVECVAGRVPCPDSLPSRARSYAAKTPRDNEDHRSPGRAWGKLCSVHVSRFLREQQTFAIFAGVADASLDPWTNAMSLDESSRLTTHCYADRFSIVRVEDTRRVDRRPVRKSSSVPAVLVSVFVQPVATPRATDCGSTVRPSRRGRSPHSDRT